jgi:hypothetical protein
MSTIALSTVILLSSVHIPRMCTLGLKAATAFLGIGLTVTGLCFLALWSLDVIRPPPRQGAILLLLSLLGAASVAIGFGPRTTACVGDREKCRALIVKSAGGRGEIRRL